MSVEFDRGSPGNFDSRTLSRETLGRWTGRNDKTKVGTAMSDSSLPRRNSLHVRTPREYNVLLSILLYYNYYITIIIILIITSLIIIIIIAGARSDPLASTDSQTPFLGTLLVLLRYDTHNNNNNNNNNNNSNDNNNNNNDNNDNSNSMCVYIYIYIYTHVERERENMIYIYIYIYMYVYIYIYNICDIVKYKKGHGASPHGDGEDLDPRAGARPGRYLPNKIDTL